MASFTSQGIYSPLPQYLSDSDSEKEINSEIKFHKYTNVHLQNGNQINHFRHNGCAPTIDIAGVQAKPTMSPMRKLCFLTSIALCFLTIFVFVWVLPCSDSSTCTVKISSWENQHNGIELAGKINVVSSAFKNRRNLALLYKNRLNSRDYKGGIISVLGNSGAIAWYISQNKEYTNLNCHMLDVDGDGDYDCLALGEMGLEAIEPVSGEILWHAHVHRNENQLILGLDFPFLTPDVDNDGIKDLLSIRDGNLYHNIFFLISGRNGMLLGQVQLSKCYDLYILKYKADNVTYSCKNDNGSRYYSVHFKKLSDYVLNKTNKFQPTKIKYASKEETLYVLSGRKLIINNVGECTVSCRCQILLANSTTNNEIISWSYPNSYAMKPAVFTFKTTKVNFSALKGHVNGYIVKLWQWSRYTNTNKKPDKNSKSYISNVMRRSIVTNNTTVAINSIAERVLLITFNDTSVHVINISFTEITQICYRAVDTAASMMCQPDLTSQNNSLLVTDLDADGSQEVVSYSSTFLYNEDGTTVDETWQLVSNLKVIRLEAELPKLYDAAK